MSPRGESLNERMRAEAMTKITGAALRIFAEYGYHGATMRQITDASGLSKGLVYYYFPSKDRLFSHLVESALDISRAIWNGALDSPGSAWERIEKLSAALVREGFTEESSLFFNIMLQALTQETGIPGLREHINRNMTHYERLPSLLMEAQEAGDAVPGDPEVLVSTYFALLQGYTLILPHNESLRGKITPEVFTDALNARKRRV
jgi:AcrR family transcriptional regulator